MKKFFFIDFGGVLYDVDPGKAIAEFAKIADSDIALDFTYARENVVKVFERGTLSPKEFRDELRLVLRKNVSDKILDAIWNSILIGPRQGARETIAKFKPLGSTCLLSNTNVIHYDQFYPECKELFSEFDELFFSYKIGKVKPDPEIFEYVLKRMGSTPENAYFFDDSSINVESASKMGINSFKVNNLRDLDILRKRLESS